MRVCVPYRAAMYARGVDALPRLCGVYAPMIASSSVFTCARMLPIIGRFGPHWGLDMLGPCLCMPALSTAPYGELLELFGARPHVSLPLRKTHADTCRSVMQVTAWQKGNVSSAQVCCVI